MYSFEPFITLDGSVGLYNADFKDIYHSADGALSEAYEKFVLPVDYNLLKNKDSIKVLDICYGIGYNSKSFLNFLLDKNFLKNNQNFSSKIMNIEPIHTNKISTEKCDTSNEPIHTDNNNPEVYIKAVDNDEILIYLSSFFNTGLNNKNQENLKKYYKNIDKKAKKIKKRKINKLINFLFFEKIFEKYPKSLTNSTFLGILFDPKNKNIFSNDLKGILKLNINKPAHLSIWRYILLNLHNIYYKYITKWYKWRMKIYNLRDICFDPVMGDARDAIKVDKNLYNLIFLDAFTPSKCPCLWSYDFIKLLYEHIEDDGLLLTYSSAATVRSAMLHAGFYIGYIYNPRTNMYIGTVASKNKNLIKYPLSEFDFGLLNTKAGIFYRDETLSAQNESINACREKELLSSNKMSSSEYKRKFYH